MDDATQQYSGEEAVQVADESVCTLIGLNKKSGTFKLYPDKREWIFGRKADCDVVLPDIRRVSNAHFRIWLARDVLLIEDTSTNGTYLNETRLPKHKSSILTHGDEIGVAFGVVEDELRFLVNYGKKQPRKSDFTGIHAKYDLGDVLGKGAFATVRKAVERATGEEFAVKIIARKRVMTEVKREVDILMMVNHTSVVKLKEYYEDTKMIYLVMEYVPGGDLMDYVSTNGPMSDATAKSAVRQVLLAIAHLHSLGISHRDIKPDNILVQSISEDSIGPGQDIRVKVSDFGLAKISSGSFLKTFCGTLAYLAPEVITARQVNAKYSNAVDMWSVGCLVYVLLTGYLPFNGNTQEQLCAQIVAGQYHTSPLDECLVGAQARQFIHALLQTDPTMRPSASTALLLEWMRATEDNVRTTDSIAIQASEPSTHNMIVLDSERDTKDEDVCNSTDLSKDMNMKDQDSESGVQEPVIGVKEKDANANQDNDKMVQEVRNMSIGNGMLENGENIMEDITDNGVDPKTSIIEQEGLHVSANSSVDRVHSDSQSVDRLEDTRTQSATRSVTRLNCVLYPLSSSIPARQLLLFKTQTWFGRTKSCDVTFTDTRTSKLHCCISCFHSKYYISDFSTNGCYVNNVKIGNGNMTRLYSGDEIAMFREGSVKLAYRFDDNGLGGKRPGSVIVKSSIVKRKPERNSRTSRMSKTSATGI